MHSIYIDPKYIALGWPVAAGAAIGSAVIATYVLIRDKVRARRAELIAQAETKGRVETLKSTISTIEDLIYKEAIKEYEDKITAESAKAAAEAASQCPVQLNIADIAAAMASPAVEDAIAEAVALSEQEQVEHQPVSVLEVEPKVIVGPHCALACPLPEGYFNHSVI